jgi:hypothetical protein
MSRGYDGHAAELREATAGAMSCGYDGHAAELREATAGAMSRGDDGHTAELREATAGAMSRGYDGHAAELRAAATGAMPCGYDGHAAELHEAASSAATAARLCAAQEDDAAGAMRLRHRDPVPGAALAAPAAFRTSSSETMMGQQAVNARFTTLVASAALLWAASCEMASAQSRLFSCPHARIIELTVTGPDTISADRDVGKPVILKRDPANPSRYFNGGFAVTLTPDQGELALVAPDWGSTKCLFGSQNVKPFIP